MNTHELGDALIALGKVLKKSPACSINEIKGFIKSPTKNKSSLEVALSLDNLVELSKVDKKQWLDLIIEYNFDIDLRPRDAARDILDKILRYLQANEHARKDFKEKISKKKSSASPELINALGSLMRED